MANNSLYALANEYSDLYRALTETVDEDGLVDADVFAAVEQAKGTFEEKAVAVATVWRMLGNDVAQIKNEIDRLKALKDRVEREQERVKQYLAMACEKTGTDSVKGVSASVSFRASELTVIDDESEIPEEYIVVKTTTAPDKTKIKNAIKAGLAVPGAHIESKRNIQIR